MKQPQNLTQSETDRAMVCAQEGRIAELQLLVHKLQSQLVDALSQNLELRDAAKRPLPGCPAVTGGDAKRAVITRA